MTNLQAVFTDIQGFDKLSHLRWKNEGDNFSEFIVQFFNPKEINYDCTVLSHLMLRNNHASLVLC